jgi:enamine deaminase RidA (YjgF/YER057c/UK114 family)
MSETIDPAIKRLQGVSPHKSSGSAYNGFVFCVSTSPTKEGGIAQQARDTFARLDKLLEQLGSHRNLILQTTIYLAHHEQKTEFDAEWAKWIGDEPLGWPQRAGIGVHLAPGTYCEVALIAAQRKQS